MDEKSKERLKEMREQLLLEMPRLLHYWKQNSWDAENHVFITLGCDNRPLKSGKRSTVLAARILWAFSSAFRLNHDTGCREMADQAYEDLTVHYLDRVYGGAFESLCADGTVLNDSKVVYTQTYLIYGLSEYYLASGCTEALETAIEIFQTVEKYSRDPLTDGYAASCRRDWSPEKGLLTVDTYLHLTEAYTNLYKAWPDACLKESLRRIANLLLDRWIRPNGALFQTLQADWKETDDLSDRFADDAECAWMILEAAAQMNEPPLTERVNRTVSLLTEHIAVDGYDTEHGGVFDRSYPDGHIDDGKMWWEESESVIGLLYGYRETKEPLLLEKALGTWDFLRKYIIDPTGEWKWKTQADGTYIEPKNPSDPLKCPYHGTRISVLCIPLIDEICN